MAEKKNYNVIYDDNKIGSVIISDEIIAVMAVIAASEVEGVSPRIGDVAINQITRAGMKSLAKGVKVHVENGAIAIRLALNIKFGYSIPEVSKNVQLKVKEALENMTGLNVVAVHVTFSDVQIKTKKPQKARTAVRTAKKEG